jgi:hypothetical protein
MTRLPESAHTSRPWRIHELAGGFRVEDVWALPTPGGPDDFPRLVALLADYDPADSANPILRGLFALRWRLGRLFGWEREDERSFSPLLEAENEWAAEIVNKTVHGILHLGWVEDERGGGYRGQLAVLSSRTACSGPRT